MATMLKILDRYPFNAGIGTGLRENGSNGLFPFDPLVPLVVTSPRTKRYPFGSTVLKTQEWAFDTCCTGDGMISPEFLRVNYGSQLVPVGTRLKPELVDYYLPEIGEVIVRSSVVGAKATQHPLYLATLWVIGNNPELPGAVCRLPLSQGLGVETGRVRPLIGRGAFIGQGFRVELDFDEKTPSLSLWVPESAVQKP